MSGLIPLYAAVTAALHFVVSADVGANVIETITVRLHQGLREIKSGSSSSGHSYIGDKIPVNLMLMLVYLYSLRVVHHSLVVDVMESIVDGSKV